MALPRIHKRSHIVGMLRRRPVQKQSTPNVILRQSTVHVVQMSNSSDNWDRHHPIRQQDRSAPGPGLHSSDNIEKAVRRASLVRWSIPRMDRAKRQVRHIRDKGS